MGNAKTLILLAHGSRAPEAREELSDLAVRLEAAAGGPSVRGAFLSLGEPDLAEACRAAVADGAREIDVLPLFLFSGKHMLGDIPFQVESLRRTHPGLSLRLLPSMAGHPAFVDFLLAASRLP